MTAWYLQNYHLQILWRDLTVVVFFFVLQLLDPFPVIFHFSLFSVSYVLSSTLKRKAWDHRDSQEEILKGGRTAQRRETLGEFEQSPFYSTVQNNEVFPWTLGPAWQDSIRQKSLCLWDHNYQQHHRASAWQFYHWTEWPVYFAANS